MHQLFDKCNCGCEHTNANVPVMPLIGDAAPAFTAKTTNGPVDFPADYRGKWVILFSHPADFTPVCTSEFMTFQAMLGDFKKINTEIIGLSVDSMTSHIAWLRAIRNLEFRGWKDMEITFPLIDDIKMDVAKKYGMIQPNASDTKAVRAVFIIDPNGIIRTILYYPLTTGRNFDEIKRIVTALQTADAFGVATPADWRPGEDAIIGAPSTMAGARERIVTRDKSLVVKDWFFTFKKLSASTIFDKLYSRPATKKITNKKTTKKSK